METIRSLIRTIAFNEKMIESLIEHNKELNRELKYMQNSRKQFNGPQTNKFNRQRRPNVYHASSAANSDAGTSRQEAQMRYAGNTGSE